MYDNIVALGVQFARWEPSLVDRVISLYQSVSSDGASQGRLLGDGVPQLARESDACGGIVT
jgi:hypothetical protein